MLYVGEALPTNRKRKKQKRKENKAKSGKGEEKGLGRGGRGRGETNRLRIIASALKHLSKTALRNKQAQETDLPATGGPHQSHQQGEVMDQHVVQSDPKPPDGAKRSE